MKQVIISLLLLVYCINSFPQSEYEVITQVVDAYPMLSPDGSKIVFSSNRTGSYQIYTCSADGSHIIQLTDTEGSNSTPVWSPQGDKIVFASERDNDSEIYIMNADGTNQIRLTQQPGDDSHPRFSPDGKRIIFNSPRTTPDLSVPWLEQFTEIFTMDPDGNNVTQLTSFKSVCTYPGFSPDGSKIVFRRITRDPGLNWSLEPMDANSEIFVMNSDGSNPVNISNSDAYDGWPCWMADNQTILFTSNRGGLKNQGQLYTVKLDGSHLSRVTELENSFVQASLSRDGSTIYAQRNWETEAYEYGHIVAIPIQQHTITP
jgi:TolB protein